jgi:hypothetical protein
VPCERTTEVVTWQGVARGALLAIGLNAALFAVAFGLLLVSDRIGGDPMVAVVAFFLMFQGVLQLPYMAPLFLWMRRRDRAQALGMVIGSGLYLVGHGGCTALILFAPII